MKKAALALVIVLSASPAFAQLGGLGRKIGQAKQQMQKVQKISDLRISDKQERAIGEDISLRLRERFGVMQDAKVTRYVSLVGGVLAQASTKPDLTWQFIVLDTDGVNAYAAPGGLVHITRGMLGLIKNEAELAGVIGHEIGHITARHTIRAIQKGTITGATVEFAADEVTSNGLTQAAISKIGQAGYNVLFQNAFDRGDEMESDKVAVQIAGKVGYAADGLKGVLQKIGDRNKGEVEPNGLFASHPQLADRIAAIERQVKSDKLTATATVASRYAGTITFDVSPTAAIATVLPGVRGAVGAKEGEPAPKEEEKKEAPKKGSRFGGAIGNLVTGNKSANNTQTVASAGTRGVRPDWDATGGPNSALVRIAPLTPAELEAFRKGIAG